MHAHMNEYTIQPDQVKVKQQGGEFQLDVGSVYIGMTLHEAIDLTEKLQQTIAAWQQDAETAAPAV